MMTRIPVDYPQTKLYGKREPAFGGAFPGVLSAGDTSATGNVILAAGSFDYRPPGGHWEKTEHIVLTPEEARDLSEQLAALAAVGMATARDAPVGVAPAPQKQN
jgi:hypothetical protein